MAKQTAGILLFKREKGLEVFLVHPGGPFFSKKDAGAWSIPKGEFTDDEDPLHAAKREFEEETGTAVNGDFITLPPIKQKSGKMVYAWALEGNIDAENVVSNFFEMAWPPGSANLKSFPEIDKGVWFSLAVAREKINEKQAQLLDFLVEHLGQKSDNDTK